MYSMRQVQIEYLQELSDERKIVYHDYTKFITDSIWNGVIVICGYLFMALVSNNIPDAARLYVTPALWSVFFMYIMRRLYQRWKRRQSYECRLSSNHDEQMEVISLIR